MTAKRFDRLQAVLRQRQPDLTVIMENVHKPHNLSAIVRTCDAVGIFQAHAVSTDGDVRQAVNAAKGSQRWVGLRSHRRLEDTLDMARDNGMQVLAAHLADDAVDFRDVDYTRPTALLMGSELDGVSPAARDAADQRIVVPMHGLVASLNVSVATALILFEAERQRRLAGMYEHSRLDPDVYRRTLFEWTQPRIAAWCRRKGLDYPALDADGDVIGLPASETPDKIRRSP